MVRDDSYEFKIFQKSTVETGIMEMIVSKSGYLLQINSTSLELVDEASGYGEYDEYTSYISKIK